MWSHGWPPNRQIWPASNQEWECWLHWQNTPLNRQKRLSKEPPRTRVYFFSYFLNRQDYSQITHPIANHFLSFSYLFSAIRSKGTSYIHSTGLCPTYALVRSYFRMIPNKFKAGNSRSMLVNQTSASRM